MSRENVELMRRTFERWNAGEREVDPEILDPEVVIHSAMTRATYHGYEGLRRWMAEIDRQFDDWTVSIDDFRDASEGRLLALGTVHVRGRSSGVSFDQPMALLLAFAEGRLIELRTIPDHAQALEAAGLSEAMSEAKSRSERPSLLPLDIWASGCMVGVPRVVRELSLGSGRRIRRHDLLKEADMALSDELTKLAARANEAEEHAAAAQSKAKADLEAEVKNARASAQAQADRLHESADANRARISAWWHDIQRSWNQHMAALKEDMTDRKAEHDLDRANKRAENAESDAAFAIAYASAAIEEAEYAVLDASLARMEADELAGTSA